MAALGWLMNLDFAASGADAPAVVEPTTPDGGGRGAKGRGRYPRRVIIGGRVYWVKNAEEERRLLADYIASLEAHKARLEERKAPETSVAKARVAIVRAERRLEKVDDREARWHAKLKDEDEEILLLLH